MLKIESKINCGNHKTFSIPVLDIHTHIHIYIYICIYIYTYTYDDKTHWSVHFDTVFSTKNA